MSADTPRPTVTAWLEGADTWPGIGGASSSPTATSSPGSSSMSPPRPRLECFRLASAGAIHHTRAVAILAAHGHPDAGLRVPGDGVIGGRFR